MMREEDCLGSDSLETMAMSGLCSAKRLQYSCRASYWRDAGYVRLACDLLGNIRVLRHYTMTRVTVRVWFIHDWLASASKSTTVFRHSDERHQTILLKVCILILNPLRHYPRSLVLGASFVNGQLVGHESYQTFLTARCLAHAVIAHGF